MTRVAIAILSGAPLVLLSSRTLQVALPEEHSELGGHPWSFVSTIGYGVLRRIDDAHFWIVIALWLTTTRLVASWDAARRMDDPARGVPRSFVVLGAVAAAGLTSCYLFGEREHLHGFWWKPPESWNPVAQTWVAILQHLEGVVLVAASLSAGAGVIVGLDAIARVKRLSERESPTPALCENAGTVVAACLRPFVAASLFLAAVELVKIDEESPLPGGARSQTPRATAVGWVILYAAPFLLLLIRARFTWRTRLIVSFPIATKVFESLHAVATPCDALDPDRAPSMQPTRLGEAPRPAGENRPSPPQA